MEECDCPNCQAVNDGPQGFTGSQGPETIGSQGPRGTQGEITMGAVGFQGFQGPEQIGLVGNDGAQGGIASPGWQGAVGDVGFQGSNDVFFRGFQGLAGRRGVQGPSSDEGAQGPIGFQGEGSIGLPGFYGPQGITNSEIGSQGPSGFQGPNLVQSYVTSNFIYAVGPPALTENFTVPFTSYVRVQVELSTTDPITISITSAPGPLRTVELVNVNQIVVIARILTPGNYYVRVNGPSSATVTIYSSSMIMLGYAA